MMDKTTDKTFKEQLVKHRHSSIEGLRIFLGLLLLYKGYYFVENITEIYALTEDNAPISPFIVSHYVVAAHLVGGLMLATGLLTRLAAAVQLPVLFGAVVFVHAREVFLVTASELEYSILILVLLFVFIIYGGGKWSADHYIIRRKEKTAV